MAETTVVNEAGSVQGRAIPSKSRGGRTWSELGARYALLAIFAAMLLGFSTLRPDTFATTSNLTVILNQSSILAIFSCGVTLVLLCGEFDLAFPSIADTASIVVGVLVTTQSMTSPPGIIAAVLVGLGLSVVWGLVGGTAVALAKVPSFVATLAVGAVAAGFELATQSKISGGLKQISTLDLPPGLQQLGTATLPGTSLSLGVAVAAVVVILVWALLRFTVLGRQIYAVGGNADAAYVASVPVVRVRIIVFSLAGLLAGISGVIGLDERGYFNGASPPLLLQAYTVAFLGTAVLALRRFTIVGTIAALFFVQVLSNGLGLLNQPTWITSVVNGCVLLTAVVLTRRRSR